MNVARNVKSVDAKIAAADLGACEGAGGDAGRSEEDDPETDRQDPGAGGG